MSRWFDERMPAGTGWASTLGAMLLFGLILQIATGIVLALYWPSALVYALVWLGLLALLRISSVAGMAAAVSAPVSAALFSAFDIVLLLLALALLVLWKHRENIDRLLSGTEPRIGAKKPPEPDA